MEVYFKLWVKALTIWFEEDASPVPSAPYIIKFFGTWRILLAIPSPSPGVCVDGVDGGELVEGPTVFPVPVLFAGPDDVGCFRFLLFWK